jgi:hypothetical protein
MIDEYELWITLARISLTTATRDSRTSSSRPMSFIGMSSAGSVGSEASDLAGGDQVLRRPRGRRPAWARRRPPVRERRHAARVRHEVHAALAQTAAVTCRVRRASSSESGPAERPRFGSRVRPCRSRHGTSRPRRRSARRLADRRALPACVSQDGRDHVGLPMRLAGADHLQRGDGNGRDDRARVEGAAMDDGGLEAIDGPASGPAAA